MENESNEKFIPILKDINDLHFCSLVILYYHKNVNKTTDLGQVINHNFQSLFADLPPAIRELLKIYDFQKKAKHMGEGNFRDMLRQEYGYLNKNVQSVFSLWKLLFVQFASLSVNHYELLAEVFSALNLVCIADLKNMLYVGRNFTEASFSELLFVLVQLKNYQEIHIINYEENKIDVKKCLENVRDELYYVEPAIRDSMMKRVVMVQEAQLNAAYLNAYITQNSNEKFILIIGMERFLTFKDNSEINVERMGVALRLGTSENVDWNLLLGQLNHMHSLVKEKNAYLLTVYLVDNPLDDAEQKIQSHYNDSLVFDILYDQTASDFGTSEQRVYERLLNQIFYSSNAYEEILSHEEELQKENFIVLKSYYFLFHGDYFHAVTELEQLTGAAECYTKFLLAELYNITDETEAAYNIYKEIYEKDRYYPNLIPAALYSLRDTDEKEEQLLWIKRGLLLNPKDQVMVNHLANYYTMAEEYMASANEWKVLYELTDDPFYILLYEINLILSCVDKTQMKNIQAWVDEKVSLYPQYADEIYCRIGNIVFDKVNKEKALPCFEKVKESFDGIYYDVARKKMGIYYSQYFRGTGKEVSQDKKKEFVQKLVSHVLILTYGSQSIYSWNDYIQESFSYDKWVELSGQILAGCLMKLAETYLKGEANESKLRVGEREEAEFDGLFQEYGGSLMPNLEAINRDEYLLSLLAQGKCKVTAGEIQLVNDIAYTFFRLASIFEESYYKNISMCFGLLAWSDASMAIGAYAQGMISFIAAAEKLLEIGESGILHEMGYVFGQFFSLSQVFPKIELSAWDLPLLENYFRRFGYPKALLYRMLGRYEDVIRQEPSEFKEIMDKSEEANIILLAKNESLDNILFIDSLIWAYNKTGESGRARAYLCRLYPTIELTLMEHIDIAHHFLIRYSDFFMDFGDYRSAIEIFQSSLSLIEKLRGTSFGTERSYLGNPSDTVSRRIIYIICEKSRLKKEELELDGLLGHIILHLVPRSLIEERNGNREVAMDEKLFEKEKQYYQLFEILNHSKSLDKMVYKQLVDRFFETKRHLEENHPRFKPLKPYSLIGCKNEDSFVFIRSKLKEGEVFYRNILAESCLVHILVSQDACYVSSEKINLNRLGELLERLECMINDSVDNLRRYGFHDYADLFEELTQMLFRPLIVQADSFHALYYMPEHQLVHITPNFIRINGKWGVECFDRIELVIDYNDIGNSRREMNSFPDKFFISESTKGGQQIIKKTLDGFSSFSKIDFDKAGHILIQESVNTLVIVAHGISEEFGEFYYGAKKLELSRKKQINLNEFVVLHSAYVENAIIIACSGGTPMNGGMERNYGVWDSMLKKNVKYILYCKWDVSTKETNDILATILQEMQTGNRLLSEALNIAQRELRGSNPILWSGLEVWKNTGI